MKTYQSHILDTLAQTASDLVLAGFGRPIETARHMVFGNTGRLSAHYLGDMTALATVDFDFQDNRVSASLNTGKVGQPTTGPRATGVYHWTPANPADNVELDRLKSEWRDAVHAAITAV